MAELDANQVWEETKKALLDMLPFNMAIFDAFNACQAITIDEGVLVLGLTTDKMHMAGHLRTPDNRNAINQVLAQKIGPNASYNVIDGTTLDEWKVVKERQQRAAESEQQHVQERIGRRAVVASIDEISQELYRRHSELKYRQFPQIKAQFLAECIPVLADAEDKVKEQSGLNDEQHIRQWARLLDKLAGMTDVGATLIAIEITRYRRAKAAKQKQ